MGTPPPDDAGDGPRGGYGPAGATHPTRLPDDFEAGHRALRDSAALLDDTDRRLVRVRGASAREHFGGLLTNHVEALEPGRGLYAFMLTPKGRPVAEMRVLARESEEGDEVLWADLPAACVDSALDHLGRYLPPRLAAYEIDPSVRRLGVVGPEAAGVLRAAGIDGPPDEPLAATDVEGGFAGGPAVVVRREDVEGPGFDVYVAADAVPEAWEALAAAAREVGGAVAGPEARHAWRVERGVPVYGAEIDTDVLPQETGQDARAVDHEKGCYTGQEVVARIHYRGKVNRHLRGLRFDDAEALPEAGAELFAGGRSRATVTSTARSPRFGPIALAYVRRELGPGDTLALEPEGEAACVVVDLPFG